MHTHWSHTRKGCLQGTLNTLLPPCLHPEKKLNGGLLPFGSGLSIESPSPFPSQNCPYRSFGYEIFLLASLHVLPIKALPSVKTDAWLYDH